MKISDLDYLNTEEDSHDVQGGNPAILEKGLFISIKNGTELTLFEDGEEIYSRVLKRPVDSLSLMLEGFSGVATSVRTIGKGKTNSSIISISNSLPPSRGRVHTISVL
ncbi:hypothetical protein HC928_07095 [bacterium]|nr:hypothetical protein [bacterium]